MRRTKTNFAVFILLLTPISAFGQRDRSAPGEVLTLDQAISLALSDSHLVKIAELEVGKAEDNLAAIRTMRLPSMNLFSLTSIQMVQHEINLKSVTTDLLPGVDSFAPLTVPRRPTTVFTSLIAQPLSQQYRIGLTIKHGKLARDVTNEKLRQVRQSIVDRVKRTYYSILQSQ